MLLLVLNLIAGITLRQDYHAAALPSVNPSDWETAYGTEVSHTSTDLVVDSASSSGAAALIQIHLPIDTIDITMGTQLRFHVELSTDQDILVRLIPLDSLSNPLPSATWSNYTAVSTGSASFDLDFNTGGYEIPRFRIEAFGNTPCEVDFAIDTFTLTARNSYSDFDTGDRILVYWDSDAEEIVVYLEDNPGATLTLITDGPNLGTVDVRGDVIGIIVPRDHIPGQQIQIKSEFQFCDGLDLIQFPFSGDAPDFPYTFLYRSVNDSVCTVSTIVCDVQFGVVTITPASSKFVSDGAFTVTASGSHGTIKYGFYPPYDSRGQFTALSNTSGVFTGLSGTRYTVYAVDQYNCYDTISIVIPIAEALVYNPKYRLRYNDVELYEQTVADIEERGYSGTVAFVDGTGDPVVISKNNGDLNNKFDVIRPTFAQVSLNSGLHFQYLGLFNQDDRKYRLSFAHDSYNWKGFLTPSTYMESYSPTRNYPVNLKFGDTLATISDYDFLDDGGNVIKGSHNLLEIICLILKKPGLDLNILSGVNKFSTGMSTGASDDPLVQTYIDCVTFYPDGVAMKCDEVIQGILKPFGAEIMQNNAIWNIIEVDSQTATYNYRLFDSTGVYQSNGTINPIIKIDRPFVNLENVLFAESDHVLEILPAYGTMTIKHQLKNRESIFPLSLDEWQVNSNGSAAYAVPYSIPDTINKGIEFFELDHDIQTGGGFVQDGFVTFISPSFVVTSLHDAVQVKFNYKLNINEAFNFDGVSVGDDGDDLPRASYPLWIRIIWRLKLTNGSDVYYYTKELGWSQNANFTQNFIYDTNLPQTDFQSVSEDIPLPDFSAGTDISLELQLTFDGSYGRDFSDLAGLKAIPTLFFPLDSKTKGLFSTLLQDFVFYKLRATTNDEDTAIAGDKPGFESSAYPDRVLPTDYSLGNNRVIWERETVTNPLGYLLPIDTIQLQELTVVYFPNREKAPEEETLTFVNNEAYKEKLEYEIITGDVPTSVTSHQIYTNVFRLSDGTPTYGWSRVDTAENGSVQFLLLKSIANQYTKPTWRLSGTWLGPNIQFTNIIKHTVSAQTFTINLPEAPGTAPTWSQAGSGQLWEVHAGDCTVDFDGSHTGNSLYMKQDSELIPGSRIRIAFKVTRSASSGTRIDRFCAVTLLNGSVIQKVTLFDGISFDNDIEQAVSFNLDGEAEQIGFFIENISGTGTCHYLVDYFRGNGVSSVRYYYFNQMSRSDKHNLYKAEMIQLIPAVASADPTVDDTGGGNTGGVDEGGGVAGRAFSSGFSGGFS